MTLTPDTRYELIPADYIPRVATFAPDALCSKGSHKKKGAYIWKSSVRGLTPLPYGRIPYSISEQLFFKCFPNCKTKLINRVMRNT